MVDRRLAAMLVGLLASCGSSSATSPEPAMSDPAPDLVASPTDASPPPPLARATLAATRGETLLLADDGQLTVESITVESIAPDPGGASGYPPGTGVTVAVTLDGTDGTMTLLSAGYASNPIAWFAHHRAELVRVDGDVAHLLVDRITDRALATASIELERGQTRRLHDRVDLEFVHHGHKSVRPGQESPLMVSVAYHAGGEPEQRTYNLYPPGDATWTWRDLRFTLGAYEYGRRMELVVDALALEPALAAE
jgi:hypothetical protein